MRQHKQILIPLTFSILFAACASQKPVTETVAPPAATPPAAAVSAESEIKIVEKKVSEAPVEHTATVDAAAPAPAPAHVKSKGVAPSQALLWLQHGNTRYIKGSLRKDGQSKADILRLSKGQTPHTILLSCSDSRVPPEVIFDQKLGEIFVIRTAGESLDPNVIGSIEYAVEHLGTRLILVMGHTSCGAVKAAIQTIGGADAGSPSLNHLVADIHPRIKEILASSGTPSKDLAGESFANARGVATDLAARSEILKHGIESKEIEIRSALYHVDTGVVEF